MDIDEQEAIVEGLSFESRLAYMAFCLERSIAEAKRHPQAAQQLKELPILYEGLEILWERVEKQKSPDPKVVERILAELSNFEVEDPTRDRVIYKYDVTLVQGARTLRNSLEFLQDPSSKDASYVLDSLEGAVIAAGLIYDDYETARDAEEKIAETALLRLQEWGDKPLTKKVFQDIPEWTRGELSSEYMRGKVTGEGEEDDDD